MGGGKISFTVGNKGSWEIARQTPSYPGLVQLFCLQIVLSFILSLFSLNSSPDSTRPITHRNTKETLFLPSSSQSTNDISLHSEDCRGPGFRREVCAQWQGAVERCPFYLGPEKVTQTMAGPAWQALWVNFGSPPWRWNCLPCGNLDLVGICVTCFSE